jgi:hypothetical protein
MSARRRARPHPRARKQTAVAPEIRPENVKIVQVTTHIVVAVEDDEGQMIGPPITIADNDHFFPGDRDRARMTFKQYVEERRPAVVQKAREMLAPGGPIDADDVGMPPSG